jgi:hypothetical protein
MVSVGGYQMLRVLIIVLLVAAAQAIGAIAGAGYWERVGIFVCLAIGFLFLFHGPTTV